MSPKFVSPGNEGIPDEYANVRVGDEGYNFSSLRPKYFPRKLLATNQAAMFRPARSIGGTGLFKTEVTIQGLNTVSYHAQAVQSLLPGALAVMHIIVGEETVRAAKAAMLNGFGDPIWWTGNTYNSIHSRLETSPTTISTTVGPTTFYAPLIEFGLGPHMTYGPRPFMSNAFFAVLADFLAAMNELARIASGPPKSMTTQPYARHINSFMGGFRQFLYDAESAIGDIIPLGAGPLINTLRNSMITMARGLGDIQSILGHTVGARFVRRLEGKVTGRLIGIGANTVFTSRSVGASISGGQRIYNRIAGRATARFVQQNNTYGGLINNG